MQHFTRIQLEDHFDIFELAQFLWAAKSVIAGFMAVSLLLGGLLIVIKEPRYESHMTYSANTLPPFYDEEKAAADFKSLFYARSAFDDWKIKNPTSNLVYDKFIDTELLDGFIWKRKDEDALVKFVKERRGGTYLTVRSDDLNTINGLFLYARYVVDLIDAAYVTRAKAELRIIDEKFTASAGGDDTLVREALAIDRYVSAAETGADVFTIGPPTFPKKLAPIVSMILATSLILGALAGASFVIVRGAFRARGPQLATQ